MAKGKSTSSASSATKKKQAKKAEKRDERNKVRAIEEEEQELAELELELQGGVAGSDAEQHPTTTSRQEDDVVEGAAEGGGEVGAAAASTLTGTADPSSAAQPLETAAAAAASAKASTASPATGTQQQQRDRRGKLHKEVAPAQGKQRGEAATKKKQKKKHKKGEAPPPPRKKQYIPPPKPPRDNLDPIDIFGLGVAGGGYQRIDPEHVVTLRLLNKKDASSVERGLDELTAWIMSVGQVDASGKKVGADAEQEGEPRDETEAMQEVAEMLPVWVGPSFLATCRVWH